MAEGGADDVVLDGDIGSFQNQSEEASSSKRSSRRASVEAISAWAKLHNRNYQRPAGREKEEKEQVDYKRCIYRSNGCLVLIYA